MQPRFYIALLIAFFVSIAFGSPVQNINRYIENPAMVAENQEPPHVDLVPFNDIQTAIKRDRDASPWYQSLNGEWDFKWYRNPDQVPDDFMQTNNSVSWEKIKVPGVWQMQGYGYNMYRNIPQALFPYDPPRVPDDLNPTGCYRTSFTIAPNWDGRTVFLHFEGVKSASFVWINGQYVGYDQGGMTPAEYNITPYLQPGANSLAVQVIRWSDGSYFEDQDMWRFAGIHRNVYLYAASDIHLRDVDIRSELDDNYTNAELNILTDVTSTSEASKFNVTASLYGPDGEMVAEFSKSGKTNANTARVSLLKTIKAPLKWSAEKPNLYTVVLQLTDDQDRVLEVVSQRHGFRKLELKDGLALVNGVAVDFMGVNRHEHHPVYGRTMTEAMMRKDLELMKQFNVNAVRTCHYPNTSLWYDLCDEYGIYIQDEVNAECHYGENWYMNVPGIIPSAMDRFTRMVHRDKNHPCVVMWSTGNECGLGEIHYAMADWIKRFDPDRFLMHQGNWPNGWAPFVDIDGPRYRSPYGFIEAWNERQQPIVSGEYAHAMGNSLGHFDEFWEVFRNEPQQQGGFIWDWVDQGIWEELVLTQDQSPNNINCALLGRPAIVDGPSGKALDLSGLDDYVEIYRDPALDLTGNALTLVADIYPRLWECSNPIITKGESAYGLQQLVADTLEFYIQSDKRHSLKAYLPRDWQYNWHRVAGLYNGNEMALVLDGKVIASKPCKGNIAYNYLPVYVGRNAEFQHEQYPGWLSNSIFDNIGIFDRALSLDELDKAAELAGQSALWLNFEQQTEKGEFLSYGSSPFCINGVIFSDRSVQPETWQMKHSHAPVRAKAVDAVKGIFHIYNYHNFTNLNELDLVWTIVTDGIDKDATVAVKTETMIVDLAPRSDTLITIPYNTTLMAAPNQEYRLLLSFQTRKDHIWAPKGHQVVVDEFMLNQNPVSLATTKPALPVTDHVVKDNLHTFTGKGYSVTFDEKQGTISSWTVDGIELLTTGPVLNAYRAPILNEWSEWGEREMDAWHRTGLDKLEHTVTGFSVNTQDENHITVTINTLTSAPGHSEGFENTYTWTLAGRGVLKLHHHIKSVGDFDNTSWLPKMGLRLEMPQAYDQVTWLGRGPIETYPDRKTGALTGIYSGSVSDQYVPYMVPQDHGNKTDVRWVKLTNKNNMGLLIKAPTLMNMSVTPYNNIDRALYAFQLLKSGTTIVNVDHQVTGVGGTPVPTRPAYRVFPQVFDYDMEFYPIGLE